MIYKKACAVGFGNGELALAKILTHEDKETLHGKQTNNFNKQQYKQ